MTRKKYKINNTETRKYLEPMTEFIVWTSTANAKYKTSQARTEKQEKEG